MPVDIILFIQARKTFAAFEAMLQNLHFPQNSIYFKILYFFCSK